MKTIHLFIFFIIVAIAQILVPTHMILQEENTLKIGKAYKFKTRPIDPTDPFRGKYITLNYELGTANTTDNSLKKNDKAYLYFKNDSLGFAKVDTISKEKINAKKDYILLNINRVDKNWNNKTGYKVYFNLPFNRFYMEETKAKPAEDMFRTLQRDSSHIRTYALVYVNNGKFVLDNVFINDIPIANYIEE